MSPNSVEGAFAIQDDARLFRILNAYFFESACTSDFSFLCSMRPTLDRLNLARLPSKGH
jgi:hypothetical protein